MNWRSLNIGIHSSQSPVVSIGHYHPSSSLRCVTVYRKYREFGIGLYWLKFDRYRTICAALGHSPQYAKATEDTQAATTLVESALHGFNDSGTCAFDDKMDLAENSCDSDDKCLNQPSDGTNMSVSAEQGDLENYDAGLGTGLSARLLNYPMEPGDFDEYWVGLGKDIRAWSAQYSTPFEGLMHDHVVDRVTSGWTFQ